MAKIPSTESVLKQQTWTNNGHQTNKRWNKIYEFFTIYVRAVDVCATWSFSECDGVWMLLCVDVPLDGINNNKAKLRDSLITISRFHLTAVCHCKQTGVAIVWCAHLYAERWEMFSIERCHLFCVAIKVCARSIVLFGDYDFIFTVAMCWSPPHPAHSKCPFTLAAFTLSISFRFYFQRNYSVANIIVNCNFFHNIFMCMRFALFSIWFGVRF